MSLILVMELNSKSPAVWDWEDLVGYPSREVPEKMMLVNTDFEATNGFESGSFHYPGDGIGGSTSLAISQSFSQDFSCTNKLASGSARTSPMADISIGSGESLIGLKLGKRTYFESVSGESSSSKESPAISNGKVRRSKIYSQSKEIPFCQVEGCSVDLSSAKEYHRKHRVCETHSKSSKVIIRGLERRFCQQCSRFHSVPEFDEKKRSCRRRLSDHNARRRKSKPGIKQFDSRTVHSFLQEGQNQISFAFNQVPVIQTRPDSNSKLIQGRVGLFSPIKTECSNELQPTWIKSQDTDFMNSCGTQALQSKEVPVNVRHQGLQVSTTVNSPDAAQNPSALSLLSTSFWGLGISSPAPAPQQQHHSFSLGLPAVSTEYWEQSSHHALSLLSSHSWGSCDPGLTQPLPRQDQSNMVPHHHQNCPLGLSDVSAGFWPQSISSGLEVPGIQQSDENITLFQQSRLKETNESNFYQY